MREMKRWPPPDFTFFRRHLVAILGKTSYLMMIVAPMIAAIDSMTTRERSEPALIDDSRIERISTGSGTDALMIRVMLRELCSKPRFVGDSLDSTF
jgi:hypothetical protein